QSTPLTITYSPTTATSSGATVNIAHSGTGLPLQISLSGTGVSNVPISFAKSLLGNTPGLDRPTTLQFGPDGRLYVGQQNGLIRGYTITRSGANNFDVTAQEIIALVQQIPNHNDNGDFNPSVTER